jgi:hypothetical protein
MRHENAMRALLLLAASLGLSGCYTVAKTAVDVVTLPVKAVSAGVDAATTSQSEADEKRGRELRKAEEEAGKRHRQWAEACRRAQARGEPCPPPPSAKPN